MRQVTLQELGKIVTGNTPSKAEEKNYLSDDIPFIKPDDFFSFSEINTSVSNRHFISEFARTKARIVPKNTVMVTCIGNIGKVMIADSEVAFNQQINGIVTNNQVLSGYLAYQLLHHRLRLEFIANAPVVPIINKTQFSEFTLEIHECLNVQENIVNILDLVSLIIRKRKKYLNVLDNLIKSRFNEMFGEYNFEVEKLKNNVKEMLIGPFGSSLKNNDLVSEDVSYCMVYEQKHAIQSTMEVPTRFITEEKYRSLRRFTIRPGDFIISCRGTIGKIFLVPDDAPIGVMHPSIMKISLADTYNKTFFQFLLAEYMNRSELNSQGSGVKMAITAKALGEEYFPLPPLPLQEKFARFVEAVDKSKLAVKQSLDELETLKKKLMQDYFG